jgi:hypothetical protein
MSYHSSKELQRFQLILDHWTELVEMTMPFKFLFVDCIGERLQTSFEHRFLEYRDFEGRSKDLSITLEWAYDARYISENVDCDCWFWWETDVLPVRKDCFTFLMKHWNQERLIMGYHVRDNRWGMRNRINGSAFYSKHYWKAVEPRFNPEITFDRQMVYRKKKDKDRFLALNKWYALTHHEDRLLLTKNLRIVHGIKDESLIRQVLDGVEKYPAASDVTRAAWCMWKVVEDWRYDRHSQPEVTTWKQSLTQIQNGLDVPAPVIAQGMSFTVEKNWTDFTRHFLGSGWAAVKPTHVWSDGSAVELNLKLASDEKARLYLDLAAFIPTPEFSQHIEVTANKVSVGTVTFTEGANRGTHYFELPGNLGESVTLTILIEKPISPKAAGLSGDSRELGVALYGFGLVARPAEKQAAP